MLFYKGRIYLGDSSGDLKGIVLQQVHNGPLEGHLGYLKTLHRLQRDFHWSGIRKDLKQNIKQFDVC